MRPLIDNILKNPDFAKARLITYAVLTIYILAMALFDPFRYSCSPENPCPGCGFRTGLWLILRGQITEGLQANFFVGPFLIFAIPSVFDARLCFSALAKSRLATKQDKR